MPTHLRPQTDESRSSLAPTYILGALSLILAFISILVDIELSVTTPSGSPAAVENVNRAGKANRLLTLPTIGRNILNPPVRIWASDQELFDGCEALASPLAHSPLAQMAGRCLS
jgi:hypothetical protein